MKTLERQLRYSNAERWNDECSYIFYADGVFMGLIFRRILASFINSVIALILIIIICFLIGATLWFFPIRSYLNMNFVFLIFAVAYATLGNLGKGGVPPIGGRIAGIKLVTTTASDTPSFFQILIRNILYIIAPAMILTASNLMPNIFDIENTGIYFGIITIAFIIIFFSILLVPISIVVGQGKKGLHDVVCKLAVSKRSSNEKSDITIKYIFYRSLIWTDHYPHIFIYKYQLVMSRN